MRVKYAKVEPPPYIYYPRVHTDTRRPTRRPDRTPSPMTELVKIREKNTPEVKGLWSEVQYNTKAVIKALSPKLTKL